MIDVQKQIGRLNHVAGYVIAIARLDMDIPMFIVTCEYDGGFTELFYNHVMLQYVEEAIDANRSFYTLQLEYAE